MSSLASRSGGGGARSRRADKAVVVRPLAKSVANDAHVFPVRVSWEHAIKGERFGKKLKGTYLTEWGSLLLQRWALFTHFYCYHMVF